MQVRLAFCRLWTKAAVDDSRKDPTALCSIISDVNISWGGSWEQVLLCPLHICLSSYLLYPHNRDERYHCNPRGRFLQQLHEKTAIFLSCTNQTLILLPVWRAGVAWWKRPFLVSSIKWREHQACFPTNKILLSHMQWTKGFGLIGLFLLHAIWIAG